MPGAARVSGGIIGVDPVTIGVTDIGGVDQIIASRTVNDAVAQKCNTRFELHRIDADRIIGVKVIPGIGRQKRCVS